MTYQSITFHLFLDEGTTRNNRKRYVEGGIQGLVTDTYSGKRSHLRDKEKDPSKPIRWRLLTHLHRKKFIGTHLGGKLKSTLKFLRLGVSMKIAGLKQSKRQ
jgi:hypothetical protein